MKENNSIDKEIVQETSQETSKEEVESTPVVLPTATKENDSKKDINLIRTSIPFCPEVEHAAPQNTKVKTKETFARNYHFKKEGKVHRIRTFIEDSEEGSYQKTLYFVEDKDGFPEITEFPKGKTVDNILENADVIYESQDISYSLSNKEELSLSIVNGEVVKVNAPTFECNK